MNCTFSRESFIKKVAIKLGWKDKVDFNRYGKMGHNRLKTLEKKQRGGK